MVKAANLILALLLALAPGMDAVRAIHALDLCGHSVEAEHTDGSGHHDGTPGREPGECPTLSQLPQNLPVLNFDAPQSVDLPPPPHAPASVVFAAPREATSRPDHDGRPPPGPLLVGCVSLKI